MKVQFALVPKRKVCTSIYLPEARVNSLKSKQKLVQTKKRKRQALDFNSNFYS